MKTKGGHNKSRRESWQELSKANRVRAQRSRKKSSVEAGTLAAINIGLTGYLMFMIALTTSRMKLSNEEELMSNDKKIVTGLGKPELHRVLIRGHDLTKELIGKITLADMTYLMLVGRFPNDGERRMTDALLTILVEHGMVSSVVSARLCYHTAPEALQAAVASSILGAGSVHLGSSEWSAKMLVKALPAGTSASEVAAAASAVVDQYGKKKKKIPGIGHRTHPEGDPRADRLFEIARETGVYGRHCELIQQICKAAEAQHGRRLPVNVTGAIGAIALDMGLPWQLTKGFALIGRTLGAVAHIGEEIRRPMAENINSAIKSQMAYDFDG
jgi:citrate synthase